MHYGRVEYRETPVADTHKCLHEDDSRAKYTSKVMLPKIQCNANKRMGGLGEQITSALSTCSLTKHQQYDIVGRRVDTLELARLLR